VEGTGVPRSLPPDALDINVDDRSLAGPEYGFGQLWRKRYVILLAGADVSPPEVIRDWRRHFGEFWPGTNRFYKPITGLKPGEVALSDLEMPAGTRLSTGVVVSHVDETSFTFVTPQGHIFAARINFSAFDSGAGTAARIEIVMRASDPLFDIGLQLGGFSREDTFWEDTLTTLAAFFGVTATPETTAECLDRHRQWRRAGNIVHNAYIRTTLYMATKPFRRLWRTVRPGNHDQT
jgi:hypothetical protein